MNKPKNPYPEECGYCRMFSDCPQHGKMGADRGSGELGCPKITEQAAEIERLKKLCAELIGSDMKQEVE